MSQHSSKLLPQELIHQFDEQGFVVVPGLFDTSELSAASHAVDKAVSNRTAGDERELAEKNRYERSFIQCMRLWEDHEDVRAFTFHPRLCQAAAELLKVPCVRLWQDQALYKEAGGASTTAHQDQTFWPIGMAPLISAWIPFDGSRKVAGAMAYVPGSHKAGRLKVVDITHQSEPYDILDDPALEGVLPQWVEAPAGSVVFHHGLTVHMAAANNSDQVRRVMTMVYFADGTPRLHDWPVFGPDRDGVKVGEPIQGPGMPIAWPRPRNDLPAPPEVFGAKTGYGFKD